MTAPLFEQATKLALLDLVSGCREMAIAQVGAKARAGLDKLERRGLIDPGLKGVAFQAVVCKALGEVLVAYAAAVGGESTEQRRACLRESLEVFLCHPDIEREIGRVNRARLIHKVRGKIRGE